VRACFAESSDAFFVLDGSSDAPSITVVVPFIGDVGWLEEATRSVLAQTVPDLELIIVSDAPPATVAHLPGWDERIHVLAGDRTGPAAARNIGIRLARGDYVAFLDADDLFLPTKLELQVGAMAESGCGFSHTSYERVTATGEPLDRVPAGRFTGSVYPTILLQCPIATPTVVVRRELLGDEPFRESLRVADDTLLWIDLARRSELLGIDEPLTRVRMHETNAALDPASQLIAWRSILHIALPRDATLSMRKRQHTKTQIHRTIALLERMRGRRAAAWLAGARAVASSIPDPEAWRIRALRIYALSHHYYMRTKIMLSRVKSTALGRRA
jgi:glycosyltransferase involved in cell wall biosynthesis